jgi:nucleotidyltransferase/DNA polymerase involved in DNA repair
MENEIKDESNTNPSASSTKLGRKGDPRMHRAVAARLADPDMTLLEALRKGGFDFPAEGGQDSTLVDADGVTLGQRKNQLSRRLRLARQQEDEKERTDKISNDLYPGFDRGMIRPFKRNASHLTNQEEDVDMSEEMGNIDRLAKYHPQYRAVS